MDSFVSKIRTNYKWRSLIRNYYIEMDGKFIIVCLWLKRLKKSECCILLNGLNFAAATHSKTIQKARIEAKQTLIYPIFFPFYLLKKKSQSSVDLFDIFFSDWFSIEFSMCISSHFLHSVGIFLYYLNSINMFPTLLLLLVWLSFLFFFS